MVSFRWNKLGEAGKTNMAHVLGRWLNPACIEEDFNCDGQIELARSGLEHYFPNDPSTVRKIWTQHKKHMVLDKKGDLFFHTTGSKNGPAT